jgi:hypothetical protein
MRAYIPDDDEGRNSKELEESSAGLNKTESPLRTKTNEVIF